MESLFLLVGGALLAFPVIAVTALVRTLFLRNLVNERDLEYRDKISDLGREIEFLRRSLADVSERLERQSTAPPALQTADEAAPQSSPPLAAVEEPNPHPVLSVAAFEQPAVPEAPFFATPEPAIQSFEQEASEAASSVLPSFEVEAVSLRTEEPEMQSVPARQPAERIDIPEAPTLSSFSRFEPTPARKSFVQTLRDMLPLEDVLGMNLFAKIGIALLVLGFALLGRVALVAMGPGGKVALLYAVSAALLGGGIWLERRDRYRLVGRAGIGGGWAMLFFTTYAMHHVAAMQVMSSNILNSVLLLGVSAAMVIHTLRYRSQVVTGLAFLLAFSTVALSQDTVYALAASVILAIGIVIIALRMGWYELEIFGILASYANHFYWLYKLYPNGVAGHQFPQFLPSAVILLLYWFVFRISYVARGIRSRHDEQMSTVAALINTTLLLAVMKFQSTHPELAFYGLLALGVLEFFFGQLPVTRRRRPAFVLLSVLGSLLMLASVPFRFSGNNIALLWMIAAEALLVAGITQVEVVFRRLGLLTGAITGVLIAYEARHIIEFRQNSEAQLIQDGILLLACSMLFYFNAHFVRHKWQHLFSGIDEHLATSQSYIGALTAFLGVWGVCTQDWTALGWAALMLGAAVGTRLLNNKHLLAQSWALTAAVGVRAALVNCHLSDPYPHHVVTRIVTLPILAFVIYLAATALSGEDDLRKFLRSLLLWFGTALLAALIWLDIAPAWVAPAWLTLAVALNFVSRRFRVSDLCYQAHVLALFVFAQLMDANLNLPSASGRYLPIVGCAAVLYAISRYCTAPDALYKRHAAWAYTWGATALLAALAWHESPQPWLTCIWAGFAFALALVDRVFDVEELPWQAHMLAALAVWRAVMLNVYTLDKWHGIDVRLLTISILVLVLYALSRWVRIPQQFRERDVHHAYSWIGSILAAWMLWSELQPVAVAVGLAAFGLTLFEIGRAKKQKQLRFQAYVALTVAFGRIFFVNLTAASLPGENLSPRIYTVVPIALINFFVWAQLQLSKDELKSERDWAGNVLAWFGTGCVTALLYFEVGSEWIVVAWSLLVLALLITSLVLDSEVFLQQAALLVAGITARGIAHNVFGGSYFTDEGWRGNFAVLSLTALVLFVGLPIAFRLRARYSARPEVSRLGRYLAVGYPDQWLFFSPVVLVTLMIAVKMNPGMVTLSWGLEGMLVILLGLAVNQRSYRINGLILLLLCVGKIVLRDAWRLAERDRYITFIVLGTALTLVSMLYNKYRDSMRRLL
jgi:hypothetical protein